MRTRSCSYHHTTALIKSKLCTCTHDFFFFYCNHRAGEDNEGLRKKAPKTVREPEIQRDRRKMTKLKFTLRNDCLGAKRTKSRPVITLCDRAKSWARTIQLGQSPHRKAQSLRPLHINPIELYVITNISKRSPI